MLDPCGQGKGRAWVAELSTQVDLVACSFQDGGFAYDPSTGGSARNRTVVVIGRGIHEIASENFAHVPSSEVLVRPSRTIRLIGGRNGQVRISPTGDELSVGACYGRYLNPNARYAGRVPIFDLIGEFLPGGGIKTKITRRGGGKGVVAESTDSGVKGDQNRKAAQGGRTGIPGEGEIQFRFITADTGTSNIVAGM